MCWSISFVKHITAFTSHVLGKEGEEKRSQASIWEEGRIEDGVQGVYSIVLLHKTAEMKAYIKN